MMSPQDSATACQTLISADLAWQPITPLPRVPGTGRAAVLVGDVLDSGRPVIVGAEPCEHHAPRAEADTAARSASWLACRTTQAARRLSSLGSMPCIQTGAVPASARLR